VFEINKGIFRPESGTQLLSCNHFSFRLQKHAKDLERLFLDGYAHAVFSKLTSIQIDLVPVKAPTSRIGTVSDQEKPRFVVSDSTPIALQEAESTVHLCR
jgi:hypothetical protein